MTDPIHALVTNDDGIDSEGLWQLAALARDCGLTPVIAAPLVESSGSSAGLTSVGSDGRVVTEQRTIPGLDGVPAYAVRALPGYIALLSSQGAFGPAPRVVLSGVNRGANTGNAVLHSGTVGAALTACTHGTAAIAVSLAADETSDPLHWRTAAEMAGRVLPWVLKADQPMVLNLNVPNTPVAAVRGLRRAGLAGSRPCPEAQGRLPAGSRLMPRAPLPSVKLGEARGRRQARGRAPARWTASGRRHGDDRCEGARCTGTAGHEPE
jgi:5'-nucleotidase